MRSILVLSAWIFFSAQSFAISRVGNARIGDDALGFETVVPSKFGFSRTLPGGLALESLPVLFQEPNASPRFGSLTLQTRNFAREYPNLAKQGKDSLVSSFVRGARWQLLPSRYDCLLVFYAEGSALIQSVLLWASGKGIVLLADRSILAKRAVQEMIDNLVLKEGACGWE